MGCGRSCVLLACKLPTPPLSELRVIVPVVVMLQRRLTVGMKKV